MSREQSAAFVSLPESGKIPAERAADLFVFALGSSFDGSLFVTTERGERVAFRIRGGLVARWHSVEGRELIGDALADLLPPEQIDLVRRHAEHHGTDELGAIRRLCLLADPALYRLHRDCLTRELRALMKSAAMLDYQYALGRDCFEGSDGLDQPIEPFGVIVETLLHAPNLEFCRERIQATRHLPLFLRGSAAGPNTDLRGGVRQVLQSLKRLPESFETLRLRNLVPESTLVAIVYALWVTDSVEQSGTMPSEAPQEASPAPESLTSGTSPRPTNQSGSYRITPEPRTIRASSSPPASEGRGPGPASGGTFPSHAEVPRRPHVKSAQELSAESKALDAWLRAVDEPALAPKALKLAEKAADYFPANSSILFYLGCLLTMNDQTLEGEAVIRHVLALDPEHLEAQNELERVKKVNRSRSRTRTGPLLSRWGIRRSV